MKNSPAILFSFALLVASCSSSPPVQEEMSAPVEGQQTPSMDQSQNQDIWAWDYSDGPRGPQGWATLNPQYEMCASGQNQSPVNLVWHKPVGNSGLNVSYTEGNATLMNTGYTLRIELTPQSSMQFQGVDYLLEKIEIRSPSEHTLSNNQLPLEMQFYHRSSNGLKQAIISLFVIKGRGSAWFDDLWNRSQTVQPYKSSATFRFNPEILIPPRQTFYHYEGSLTHPPCLEGVQWLVFNTPLQLSQEQIDAFRAAYHPNSRPQQPLNDRKVTNH